MDKPRLKDHRQIGQELELFFTDEIAPGVPFWLPKGMVIFKELEKYIRELTEKAGYQETSTPIMVKTGLFIRSGHYEKFGRDNMYNLSLWEKEEIESIGKFLDQNEPLNKMIKEEKVIFPFWFTTVFNQQDITVSILGKDKEKGIIFDLPVNYSLKPMSCPESTVIYGFKTRSYRDLPLRFSEIGRLHRREQSGEINGLLRVRQLTMDDAHIYSTEEQIPEEVANILDMMITFYKGFEFPIEFKLATRPEKFIGSEENWNKAEKDLENALKSKKLKYTVKEKDGAFYGPKIDMHIKDAHDRDWQLATVQLDFSMPEKFELTYIDSNGEQKRPVMIHRAIFGSFERFIAILTEHYQGAFPVWLSPVQVAILPIADRHINAAGKAEKEIMKNSIRALVDTRGETLQAKIRDHTLQKVPFLVIIGDKEVENSESKNDQIISVRTREGKDLGFWKLSDFLNKAKEQIDKKI